MASSSSSKKFDVFLSFRGSDVRQGFLSHLQKALLVEKIEAFVDEHLERGKEISGSLLGKIEESNIAIVIFSQNYAYSEWCLEELLKIVECRNSTGQIVIPVFYGVDPSHVQDLTGSYGHAMAQHITKFDKSLVEKWGSALKDTASLSGLVSSSFNTESELTEEIIKHTLDKLNSLYPSDSDCDGGLVGIESRVEKLMSLLSGPEDVCIVGIWGEGGIGKTTLARATFDRIRSQFDSQCFLGDVRENSEKFTAATILKDVVSELFGTSNSNMSRKRLSRKKVILVLDDVSHVDQIKLSMRYKDDFGPGSRIIITSRDRHLLNYLGAKIYAVEKLDWHEALQLFCLNAFKKKVPQEGYLQLSDGAVIYAQGLPLALEVLGSNLFQRSTEEWEDELEKLKGVSDQKIHNILRISYEGLCNVEKEMFLDIACFFEGREREEVERMLDVRGSRIGISRLAEKALISINCIKEIKMHDLIRQMAKDIVCEEKTLGKRRWLLDPEEIYYVLTEETGTEAVRGISLDMSKINKINLSPTAFRKMYNLKYLFFYTSKRSDPPLCVPQGLEYLPPHLRYLSWMSYPSKSLPLTSSLVGTLVYLMMPNSQLEELWNGVQNLPNLRQLSLRGSKKLIKVPDLSAASNLEVLHLCGCASLVEIPSLKNLSKLFNLNLAYCSRLESLPDDICYLKSLSRLDVSHCESLHGLPQNLGNLESLVKLVAHDSGLKELPDSICNLKKCTKLDVYECVNLQSLPQNLGNIEFLDHLRVHESCIKEREDAIFSLKHCILLDISGNQKNPDRLLRNLECVDYDHANGCSRITSESVARCDGSFGSGELEDLILSGCEGLVLAPLTEHFPCLERITLNYCRFSEFPVSLCNLTCLTYLNLAGNNFESIPESIQHLEYLSELVLNGCKRLKYLPESIKLLPDLGYLSMLECTSLDPNQCSNITGHFVMERIEGRRQDIPSVWHPGSEIPEKMKHKNERGSSLSFSFKLLQDVGGHDLSLYACIVLDRPIHNRFTIYGHIMDENGRDVCEGVSENYDLSFTVESKHVVFETIDLEDCINVWKEIRLVKGRKYTAEIRFEYDSTDPIPVGGDLSLSSDGVVKCGVIPLFDRHIIE